MTSYIGLVGEFEVDKEDVEAYIERYEQFLLANDITDDGKKKAIFLASLGVTEVEFLKTENCPLVCGKPIQVNHPCISL